MDDPYAEEDDDVQATRDFATLMDRGYINKYISGGRRQKAIFSYSGLHHTVHIHMRYGKCTNCMKNCAKGSFTNDLVQCSVELRHFRELFWK